MKFIYELKCMRLKQIVFIDDIYNKHVHCAEVESNELHLLALL